MLHKVVELDQKNSKCIRNDTSVLEEICEIDHLAIVDDWEG